METEVREVKLNSHQLTRMAGLHFGRNATVRNKNSFEGPVSAVNFQLHKAVIGSKMFSTEDLQLYTWYVV